MFSFHLYCFSFYLRFRLVRKLVFLYFNVNVYLMEIPCLNKVTLPYLTEDRRQRGRRVPQMEARERQLLLCPDHGEGVRSSTKEEIHSTIGIIYN